MIELGGHVAITPLHLKNVKYLKLLYEIVDDLGERLGNFFEKVQS